MGADADQSIAARLDELIAVARDLAADTSKDEDARVAAVAAAFTDADDAAALIRVAEARFTEIKNLGMDTPELAAEANALADVYTALDGVPASPAAITDADDTATAQTDADTDDADGGDNDQSGAAEPTAAADQTDTTEGDTVAIQGDIAGAITPDATPTPATPAPVAVAASDDNSALPAGTVALSAQQLDNAVPVSAFRGLDVHNMPVQGRFAALAAGDTHGYTAGQKFTQFGDIASVALDKIKGLSDGGDGFTRTGIATWQDTGRPDLYQGMSALEAGAVLDRVTDPSRLGTFDSKTMTFGQGWCRPSDLLLDLCPPASLDGMWDVPSLTISGAGIRFPIDTTFADVYSNAGFCLTEAEEIARTEDKPCYMVPCPDFDEVRLQFCGLCIEAGTLVDIAYPQLIASYVAKALVAFQHRLNARALADAWAKSTKNDMSTGTGAIPARGLPGLIATVLNSVAMNASHLRYKHRLSLTAPLEVVMPAFLRDMLQADAALRGAVENLIGTSFTTINSWFAVRSLRPQWVYDFDDAYSDSNTTKWGGVNVPKTWPTTVKILIYPAGTFAVANRPMVRVSGVRNDPQLLRQNIFLALFLETAYAVVSRCPEAIGLTIPTCVSGEAVLSTPDLPAPCTVTP